MNIAIVDEQKEHCEEITFLCREKMNEISIPIHIEVYKSGDEFLERGKNKIFHGIFLDVEIEGKDGINVKEILEKKNQAGIIFLTNHIEKMPETFGSNVCGFLEKPILKGNFEKIFNKVIQNYYQFHKIHIPIPNNKIIAFYQKEILIKDILYITSEHIYTNIYMSNGKCIKSIRKPLNKWEDELKEGYGFYRIQNSYLIHMGHIKKVKSREVIMENNQKISISRSKIKEFRKIYDTYIKRKAKYL